MICDKCDEFTQRSYGKNAALDRRVRGRRRRAGTTKACCGWLATDAERRLLETNDSRDDKWRVVGDPMEGALVALGMKAGLDPHSLRAAWPRVDDIPFDAKHRFMATLNRRPDNAVCIFVKGAPEQILKMCRAQATADGSVPLDVEDWSKRIAAAAADGERLLGFAACGPLAPEKEKIGFADLEHGLVFLGLVGFIDPPRKEAMNAVAECRSAGIEVKMITGDHAATAAAIARQLGLAEEPRVLTGHELDRIADEDLPGAVADTSVFARTSPEHKLRIVRALQSTGAVVAMTGDGVNDAPSLKQADIGIAMGEKGTDAAKEASRMVLLDDNFASIVAAVREAMCVIST